MGVRIMDTTIHHDRERMFLSYDGFLNSHRSKPEDEAGALQAPAPRVSEESEDTKGARRMPWHRKSTKDAASCDKPRGVANTP